MEDDASSSIAPKSLQELALEGQRFLEATVEAAHETLASMNEVLCNPTLWATAPATAPSGSSNIAGSVVSVADSVAETPVSKVEPSRTTTSEQEAGWAALDEARLRLRSSTSSLRAVISSIFNSPQIRCMDDPSNNPIANADIAEVEKLEQRVLELREDVVKRNQVMKVLIEQLREFISDISMWQSPNN